LITDFGNWLCAPYVFPNFKYEKPHPGPFPSNTECGRLNITVRYTLDTVGMQPLPLEDYDLIAVNFGHHNADGGHRQTLQSFADAARRWVDELVRSRRTAVASGAPASSLAHVVWLTNSPMFLRVDAYVFQFGDWRSNPRLFAYDALMRQELRRADVPVLDRFRLLLPLLEASRDCSHFSDLYAQTVLREAFVDYVMHALRATEVQ
jgi:hypothetical protein